MQYIIELTETGRLYGPFETFQEANAHVQKTYGATTIRVLQQFSGTPDRNADLTSILDYIESRFSLEKNFSSTPYRQGLLHGLTDIQDKLTKALLKGKL